MQVSFFSFLMAVLFSSLYITLVVILGRRNYFIVHFGVYSVILLFVLSIARLVLSVEFGFSRIISDPYVLPHINGFLKTAISLPTGNTITLLGVLLWIWLLGSIVFTTITVVSYIRFHSSLRLLPETKNKEVQALAESLCMEHFGKHIPCKIVLSNQITIPTMGGLFRWTILVPDIPYEPYELSNILLHELTHANYRDPLIIFFVRLFCCVFWWNPFAHLLRYQLRDLLEIRCDANVVANKTKQEKIAYCNTIIKLAAFAEQQQSLAPPVYTVGFVWRRSNVDPEKRRLHIMIESHRLAKPHTHTHIAMMLCACLLFLASFSFIIQSHVPIATDDKIPTQNSSPVADETNTQLVRLEDGTYLLYIGEKAAPIPEVYAQELIAAGYDVIDK